MAYRFESGHRHQYKRGGKSLPFCIGIVTDSNPSKCNMPGACCYHQCKHWWLPLFSTETKKYIESCLRNPKSPEIERFRDFFFCFDAKKLDDFFLETPLTYTVTHITIVHSGQGSTNGCFLVTKSPEIEKPSGICLLSSLPANCKNPINCLKT